MSTRQLRINSKEKIRLQLASFAGRKINIVLNDQTVCLGTVEGFDGSQLTLSNMRLKRMVIPVDAISEVYFDTKE